jgi:phage/plasmid-like protein (TIGR03299 family)
MPAYFDSGFTVRMPSWHHQEVLLSDYPVDWNDAREKAGLLWEPEIVPMFQQVIGCAECEQPIGADHLDTCGTIGLIGADEGVSLYLEVPDFRIVQRSDNQHVLGPVTDSFGLIYHSTMGEIVEAICGQGAKFETAGSVREGAQVWALVYLDEPFTVPGDDSETFPFFALLNSHDGSGACKAVATDIRVVCWNTYNAASMQGERTGRQFVFRHTSNVLDRIEEAKDALAGLRDESKAWVELATDLFQLSADDFAVNHFVNEFIPSPEDHGEQISDRVRENISTARLTFKSLYLDSITCDAHRGTALGLVDAATEYLDHIRGFRNRDTYLGRTILKPEPAKAKAVALARAVCG